MFTAKHNPKKHTVTIHHVNCACAVAGVTWTIDADSTREAVRIAAEDAPNVDSIKVAPCAKTVTRVD